MKILKDMIRSVVGAERIARIRSIRWKKEPLDIPLDDPDEVSRRMKFYAQFLREGDLCFDVGANNGNRVAPFLGLKARVVAVEPQEICYRILRKKFGRKINIVKKGLGEKEETREFYISNANTISSFSKEWIDAVKKDRFSEFNWNTVRKIRMTTLDRLISRYGRPAFIKIDVEGFELEVLRGLSSCIPCISYEYTTPEQTDRAIACMDYLASVCSGIQCNYSAGEGMELNLPEWVGRDEMEVIIRSEEFTATGFGDIYIRSAK